MDVFALARHEYLQPPMPKHGRQTAAQVQAQQQQQQQAQQQSSNNLSSIGGGGSSLQTQQQASFSTGLFGNMNQSSSS